MVIIEEEYAPSCWSTWPSASPTAPTPSSACGSSLSRSRTLCTTSPCSGLRCRPTGRSKPPHPPVGVPGGRRTGQKKAAPEGGC